MIRRINAEFASELSLCSIDLCLFAGVCLCGVHFCLFYPLSGLRGAPGYSLEQAHHLPIEMDPLIGEENPVNPYRGTHTCVCRCERV